ncbi:hypothetical protein TYRP_006658 [Tyrophagus putrescentiae]|nr:hypothetical protein TYRP_006658 [Tyrophagus putrescentiae]
MTIMPEHNQYQLQQQSASKSSENLRTLLPLPPPPPPPPAPSSTNKPFAKQMATLCLSNKPSCSRETLALNEDLPATTLINESSGDETGSTCLREHHQPLPVKSSSLVQQDSNNNHYHHSSSSALADPPTIVNGSCPTCGRRFDLQQAKDLKLEAIQQQILSKLNLMEKPKVNQNWLKREQALEAIRKAKLNSKIRGRSRSAAISNTGGGGGGGGINSAATNRKRHSRRESDTPVHRRLNFIESQHSSNYNRSSIVLYGNGALEDGTTTTTASAHGNNFDSLFGQDEDEEEEGEEEMESSTDEYYGKTSEIIAFAEPAASPPSVQGSPAMSMLHNA